MTRRKFLLASGVTGAAALAVGSGLALDALLKTAESPEAKQAAADNSSKLVIVTLYGGSDGLDVVIPYADPALYKARPELVYPAEKVLHLDGELGLNPVLTGLQGLWQSKQLAIVRGVSYPKPDRSHFRSMDIWQTASPAHPTGTGWVGRWLDGTKARPEAAVSFEPVLSPLLVGETRSGACVDIGGLVLPDGITTEMVDAFGTAEAGEPALQARVASTYSDLIKVDTIVQEARQTVPDPSQDFDQTDTATGTGGADSLAAQFSLIARCIEAGVPTQVYSVSLGGFDTHAGERATHERQLTQLDKALSGFLGRMAKTEAGQRVVVMVYSEFGRRVHANASQGTDHGTAGPIFLAGARVAGGFYGEQPSLTDLDDGDLKGSVDFRDVFATVITSVLKSDPDQFLLGYKSKTLPLLSS